VKQVAVPKALMNEMGAHARESYPDECCGFLLAPAQVDRGEPSRTIQALERARNEFDGERRRRFLISPDELRDAERRAERSGQLIVGFYHSHPDHPARPSQYDQEHAWPWYSYLILSVTADGVPAVGAFELDPDTSVFHETQLLDASDSLAASSMAGR
jgi:proteasome lid subunit RPN8/RPN11